MIRTLKLKWVKKINPDYKDTLLEDEIIKYPLLWNFDDIQWTEKNANTTRGCGMIPVKVDGLLFVGWAYSRKDFTLNLILSQYELTEFIEQEGAYYLKYQSSSLIDSMIGERARENLLYCVNKFHKEIMKNS